MLKFISRLNNRRGHPNSFFSFLSGRSLKKEENDDNLVTTSYSFSLIIGVVVDKLRLEYVLLYVGKPGTPYS